MLSVIRYQRGISGGSTTTPPTTSCSGSTTSTSRPAGGARRWSTRPHGGDGQARRRKAAGELRQRRRDLLLVGEAGPVAAAVAEQIASNASAIGHEATFAEHRARLTREIAERAPRNRAAGGCACWAPATPTTSTWTRWRRAFAEIHLVDIDPDAVARADRARCRRRGAPRSSRKRRWTRRGSSIGSERTGRRSCRRSRRSTAIVGDAVARVVGRACPARSTSSSSCSLLTQLQLVLLQVLGDAHPRFAELRAALNRAHVRTLGALLAPGGVALLVTDLTTSEIHPPLITSTPGADLGKLMGDAHRRGQLHLRRATRARCRPRCGAIRAQAAFAVRFPIGPWLWRNGPTQVLLVYALEIRRIQDADRRSFRRSLARPPMRAAPAGRSAPLPRRRSGSGCRARSRRSAHPRRTTRARRSGRRRRRRQRQRRPRGGDVVLVALRAACRCR